MSVVRASAWVLLGISFLLAGCSPVPKQAMGSPVALMVFGDSLSAAHGMNKEQGWVALLERQWKQEAFLGPSQSVVNASISGETTQGGRQRLEALLDEHRPSHLLIELGANDALRRKPVGETIDNLKSMVALAQARGVTVAIARIDLPASWKFIGGSMIDDAVDQVEADTGVEVITFPLSAVAAEKGMMLSDNIHPSAAAQPLLALTMKDELARFSGNP